MITLRHANVSSATKSPYLLIDSQALISEVSRFLDAFILRGLSDTTVRAYAFDLLAFYRFLDDLRISHSHLEPHHAMAFLTAQRERGTSPRTINRRIQTIAAFLNFLKSQWGDTFFRGQRNRFYKGVKNRAMLGPSRLKHTTPSDTICVKVPRRLCMPLSEQTIRTFLGRLTTYRDRSILLLMLCLGLRSCEVIGLKIHDIDFDGRWICVCGKGNKQRRLPLSDWVGITLKRYLQCERPSVSHTTCFIALKGRRRGQPLAMEGLRKIFRYRRGKSRLIKDANPHRFRHTFCTNLIRQGVSLPIVQKLMGHDSIETTLIYINLSDDDVAKDYHNAMATIERNHEAPIK